MRALMKAIDQIEEKFLVYSLMLTVTLVFIQVCMRSVGSALSWSEELCRYLFIWQCWAGVSFAEKTNMHIRIEFIVNLLPQVCRRWAEVLQRMITLGIVVFLVVYGTQMVIALLAAGATSSALHIPMVLVYLAMPLTCFVYGIRLVMGIFVWLTKKGETA